MTVKQHITWQLALIMLSSAIGAERHSNGGSDSLNKKGSDQHGVGVDVLNRIAALSPALVPSALLGSGKGGHLQIGSLAVVEVCDDALSSSPVLVSRFVSTSINTYDGHGNLVESQTKPYPADGTVVALRTWTYDKQGNVLSSSETNVSPGGVDVRTTHYANLSAHEIQAFTTVDYGGDGVDYAETITTELNHRGDPVLQTSEFYTADGVVDGRSVCSWTYDYNNHQVVYTNLDGVQVTYALDERSRPVSWDAELPNRQDPEGEKLHFTGAYGYDKFGNVARFRSDLYRPNGDGGLTDSALEIQYFYVHRGQLIRKHRFGGEKSVMMSAFSNSSLTR